MNDPSPWQRGPRITPVAIAILLLSCPGQLPDEEISGSVGGNPRPLIVMGIDGATWDVIDPLMSKGELPNFRLLVERGSRGRLISVQPYVSPVVWTTFATGCFPRHHNVLDFLYPYSPGDKRPVKSTARKCSAIWNIASQADRRVGVAGYFVTYPPEPVNGFMVSDRAFQKNVDASAHPPALTEIVDEVRTSLRSHEERKLLLRRFIPWEYQREAAKDPSDPYYGVSRVVADRIDGQSVIDEFHRRVARRLHTPDLDLFITYYRLVDHASHAAWIYYDSSDFEAPPPQHDVDLLQDLIPATYRYMDDILGELIELAGTSANIVVLSDHGFGSATGPWRVAEEHRDKLTGNHRPDGIWLAAGPDIKPGEVQGMSILDIAPTLLAMQRLPVSTELPGRISEDVLRDGFFDVAPVHLVDSYAVRPVTVGYPQTDIESEQESLRTLKALGYVGGGTELAAEELHADAGFWEIDIGLRRRALAGEMVFHLLNDDIEAVRKLFRLVSDRDPGLVGPLVTATLSETTRLEESLEQTPFSPRILDSFHNLSARILSIQSKKASAGERREP